MKEKYKLRIVKLVVATLTTVHFSQTKEDTVECNNTIQKRRLEAKTLLKILETLKEAFEMTWNKLNLV